ncbi:copper chaperone PCu(A)C [Alteromonas sp. 345S023]|uniref:Copper chaperone PCu(A)C n=1 Tax=Alteromonas profundi TaxID=2696062 RepID=A0A7X5LNX1_9ALTE|nr:copper chaperone PCu(A)C [Alteromonas profundi]NDV92829.1 copper chaperone PCu(A)C [Alteromonas profundi]
MPKFQFLSQWLAATLIGFTLLGCTPQSTPDITVSDGYVRATFPMAKTAAVYFTIHNASGVDVRLARVSVDSAVASDAQMHTSEMQNDMMQMRQIKEGITINAHDIVEFMPGGYHVMLIGLANGLEAGEDVELTLHLEQHEPIVLILPVKSSKGEGNHHH